MNENGGLVRTSFVDYPGKISSVVFAQGCNLHCSYCHNPGLLSNNVAGNIPSEDVLGRLLKRKGVIDAVVLSGGEPTVQKDIRAFTKELKSRGFFVKLDTNGTDPDILGDLIECELLDFVAMDIKAPLDKYKIVCRVEHLDLFSIQKSVEVIKSSKLDYEFRTTFCPELEAADIPEIISDFKISSNYVLQNCRSRERVKSAWGKEKFNLLTQQQAKNSLCCSYRGFGTG